MRSGAVRVGVRRRRAGRASLVWDRTLTRPQVELVAAFEGLVRVADATGIEVDDQVYASSVELREALGFDRFRSASNTRKDAASIALDELYVTALDLFR